MKDITRHDNGETAVEQIQNHVARKQRLLQKVRDANSHTREQDAVYVDKLLNEVWVNVPANSCSWVPVLNALSDAGYDCVNFATHESEFIFKYEA